VTAEQLESLRAAGFTAVTTAAGLRFTRAGEPEVYTEEEAVAMLEEDEPDG
jgi:hypothetical protein